MKKLLTALLAMTLAVSVAAPGFAAQTTQCSFADKSMCVMESLSPTSGD